MKQVILVATVALLTGCGSGAGHSNERNAAVQAALDAKPPVATVYAGYVCLTYGSYPQGDPNRYTGIPGAHVGPVLKRPLYEGIVQPSQIKSGGPTKPCRAVSWDAGSGVKHSSAGSTYGLATLGRYILDKVGDDAQQLGGTYAPFRAHFEPSATGKALIDAHIVHAPSQSREGSMFMSKDADGHVKAQ